jgi:hypothetical protein
MCVSMGMNRTAACPSLQHSPQAQGSAADEKTTWAMPAASLFHASRTAFNHIWQLSSRAATRSGSRGPSEWPRVHHGPHVSEGGHRQCVVSLCAVYVHVKKGVRMCLSQPDRLKRVQDEAKQLEVPVSVRFQGHGPVIDLIVQMEEGPKHDGLQHASQVEHLERGQKL